MPTSMQSPHQPQRDDFGAQEGALPVAFEKLRSKLASADTPTVWQKKTCDLSQEIDRLSLESATTDEFPVLSKQASSAGELKALNKGRFPMTPKESSSRRMTPRQNSRGSILPDGGTVNSPSQRLSVNRKFASLTSENRLAVVASLEKVLCPSKASRGRGETTSSNEDVHRIRSKSLDRSSNHSMRMVVKNVKGEENQEETIISPVPRRGRRPQLSSSLSRKSLQPAVVGQEEEGRRTRSRSTTPRAKRSKSLDVSRSACRRGSVGSTTRNAESSGDFEVLAMSPRRSSFRGRKPSSNIVTDESTRQNTTPRRMRRSDSGRIVDAPGDVTINNNEPSTPLERRRRMRRGDSGSNLDRSGSDRHLDGSVHSSSSANRRSAMNRSNSGKGIDASGSDHNLNGSTHSSSSRRRRLRRSESNQQGESGASNLALGSQDEMDRSQRTQSNSKEGRTRSRSSERRPRSSSVLLVSDATLSERPWARKAYKGTM